MFEAILWVVIRSVVIPFIAFQLLKETFLEEQGALLAIGIALLITTAFSLIWNIFKILGNTIMLKGGAVIRLILIIVLQLVSLAVIWFIYLNEYTDVFITTEV